VQPLASGDAFFTAEAAEQARNPFLWVFGRSSGLFLAISDLRQHVAKHFETEKFLLAEAPGATLEDAKLIVDASKKPNPNLFSGRQ